MSAVRDFLQIDYPAFRWHCSSRSSAIQKIYLQRSLLFRRSYLVAEARDDWFKQHGATLDALATPAMTMGPFETPPIVVIPEKPDARFREEEFRSILEHEFVHLNQAILQTFPYSSLQEMEQDPTGVILKRTESEFQANFLQLVRWPALYSPELGVPLEEWCALRGYTEGLERVLHAALDGKLSDLALSRLLECMEADLPEGFRRIGLDHKIGKRFAEDFVGHMKIAFIRWADGKKRIQPTSSIKLLTTWFGKRGALPGRSPP